MEKQTAINLLGGTAKKAAQAMGYKSVQAIYLWPEALTSRVSDRVIGAALRVSRSSEALTTAQAVTNVCRVAARQAEEIAAAAAKAVANV